MKDLSQYIDENLNNDQEKSLDLIIKHNKVDVEKPIYFMSRIPKKKEIHIYKLNGRKELEEYFEKTLREPLSFGRFQIISNDKEELMRITKFNFVRKEHYKIFDEQ